MKKIVNDTLKIILIAVMTTMLISGMFLISGCKNEGDVILDGAAASEADSDAGEVTEIDEDSSLEEPGEDENTIEEMSDEEEVALEEQSGEEQDSQKDTLETEEIEEIPSEITGEIEIADNYFNEGLYAEAGKEYRDASRMISDADISQALKEELLGTIGQNQQDAESIAETARVHHTNSMTLQYEKRFDEAKAELEAALKIYPKYQIAVDALDSLEALMGLE